MEQLSKSSLLLVLVNSVNKLLIQHLIDINNDQMETDKLRLELEDYILESICWKANNDYDIDMWRFFWYVILTRFFFYLMAIDKALIYDWSFTDRVWSLICIASHDWLNIPWYNYFLTWVNCFNSSFLDNFSC